MGLPRTTLVSDRRDPRYGLEWDEDDEDAPPSFPIIDQAITDAIVKLGGGVFCKLNWSSPRDMKWMQGTLECHTAGKLCRDVYSMPLVHRLAYVYTTHCFLSPCVAFLPILPPTTPLNHTTRRSIHAFERERLCAARFGSPPGQPRNPPCTGVA